MLEVKLLASGAKVPTIGHAGEDLGYDLFALEDVTLNYGEVALVRTGIAVHASVMGIPQAKQDRMEIGESYVFEKTSLGLLICDRSSMASKGVVTSGGVIDAGYRGEIKVLLTLQRAEWEEAPLGCVYKPCTKTYQIHAGDKIAQMVPVPVLTGEIFAVADLSAASRGADGFGSTGI